MENSLKGIGSSLKEKDENEEKKGGDKDGLMIGEKEVASLRKNQIEAEWKGINILLLILFI